MIGQQALLAAGGACLASPLSADLLVEVGLEVVLLPMPRSAKGHRQLKTFSNISVPDTKRQARFDFLCM